MKPLQVLKWARSHLIWDGIRELWRPIWGFLTAKVAESPSLFRSIELVAVIGGLLIARAAWRSHRRRRSEACRRLSRLVLGCQCASFDIDGLRAWGIPVTNREHRFATVCHNVVAHVKFTSALGQVLACRGQFVTARRNRPIEIGETVSLEMLESSIICLTRLAGGAHYMAQEFPMKPKRADKLSAGEWHVEIKVTSDADEDCDRTEFALQVNPDGSSAWRPLTLQVSQPGQRVEKLLPGAPRKIVKKPK